MNFFRTAVLVLCLSSALHAAEPPRTQKALAASLCTSLHEIPADRRQQCCGAKPGNLAALCTKELDASVARGAVLLDPGTVQRCEEATQKELTGCGWITPVLPPVPAACRGAIRGQRKAGGACRSAIECQEGLSCVGASVESDGVCKAPSKALALCDVPADDLASFTRADPTLHPVCDGLCIKGVCLPFSKVGGPCQSSAVCAAGLHCIAATCQDKPLPAIGEACPGTTSCGTGAYCRAGTCAAQKGAGETCDLPSECHALACEKLAGAEHGTCADPCTAR